jgi:hypothetical protein
VRDAHELPWIDLHKEPGAKLTVRIPETMAKGASVDERDLLAPGGPVTTRRAVDAPDPEATMHLASLETSAPEARGPNELLGQLFASPFGPHAFSDWRERASQAEEPVYGVSSEDTERMRLLLEQVADMQRQQRVAGGMMLLGIGAGLGAGGAWIGMDKRLPLTNAAALSGTLFVEGGLFALSGVLSVAIRRDGERLYDDYMSAMAAPGVDSSQVLARTEQRIFDMAAESRRLRGWIVPVGWASLLAAGVLFGGDLAFNHDPSSRLEYGVTSGILAFAGLTLAVAASIPTPVERMVDLWSHDPSTMRMPRLEGLSVSPLPGGGAFLGVHGAF